MIFRTVALCAVCAFALVSTVADAAPCEGAACRTDSKALSKPLQLSKFMKPSIARRGVPAVAKQSAGMPRGIAAAKKRAIDRPAPMLAKPSIPVLPAVAETAAAAEAAAPKMVPAEAAEAFASHHPVRVVSADEVNEIDLAAGPAPADTDGSGRTAEGAVQLVDASEYNDIDRASNAQPRQPLVKPHFQFEAQPRSEPAPTWVERLWTALHGALVALAAMLWRIAG
jgi:hypothetical protein